jgi:hypothetical protein
VLFRSHSNDRENNSSLCSVGHFRQNVWGDTYESKSHCLFNVFSGMVEFLCSTLLYEDSNRIITRRQVAASRDDLWSRWIVQWTGDPRLFQRCQKTSLRYYLLASALCDDELSSSWCKTLIPWLSSCGTNQFGGMSRYVCRWTGSSKKHVRIIVYPNIRQHILKYGSLFSSFSK